jgi:3-phenylpropionate/trans-cinnamate dioxygenase ferredoxin component
MSSSVKVASRDELPPGAKKLVELDGRAIAVFNVDGRYYAIDDVCTHDGGPLAEGFDVRTGRALCMPAIEPVAVHAVELRGEDVYVATDD